MNSLLVSFLLATVLSMPQVPPSAELINRGLIDCGDFTALVTDYKHKNGSSWLVYSTMAEDTFAIIEYNKDNAFTVAWLYENGQVVRYDSLDAVVKHSAGPCEDAREMLVRKSRTI